MPGANKWTPDAERDLAMAIILSHGDIKHDWPAVTKKMTEWGYGFTNGSMSQHWTKKIMKDFKARRADSAGTETKTPKKTNKVTKNSSSKRKQAPKNEPPGSDSDESPSKKRAVKEDPEEVRRRERSATAFAEWMKSDRGFMHEDDDDLKIV